MVFVQRRDGAVVGVYAVEQPGYAEEWLADDHPEVTSFLEPPTPATVLYPVDLWMRLTPTEADQVEAAMELQTARIRNIFRAASSYRSDHELWPLLESIAVDLFGEQRAAEILAAS